jgi:hypothetical protein
MARPGGEARSHPVAVIDLGQQRADFAYIAGDRADELPRAYGGEAEALERLKWLRVEGLGFDRIAARLNDEHIPTRTGRPWHGVVVNRILTGKR